MAQKKKGKGLVRGDDGASATAVQFSTTLVFGAHQIPLHSGPIDVEKLKEGNVTEQLQEWVKSQTFSFPPGYQVTWSLLQLVQWFKEKLGPDSDPLPKTLRDVLDETITISNVSVSGNGSFTISFLVTFNKGTVDLDGFPLGVKDVGFAVAHTAAKS